LLGIEDLYEIGLQWSSSNKKAINIWLFSQFITITSSNRSYK